MIPELNRGGRQLTGEAEGPIQSSMLSSCIFKTVLFPYHAYAVLLVEQLHDDFVVPAGDRCLQTWSYHNFFAELLIGGLAYH